MTVIRRLMAFICMIFVVWGFFQMPEVQSTLFSYALEKITSQYGIEIQKGRIQGWLPWNVQLKNMSISLPDGIAADIDWADVNVDLMNLQLDVRMHANEMIVPNRLKSTLDMNLKGTFNSQGYFFLGQAHLTLNEKDPFNVEMLFKVTKDKIIEIEHIKVTHKNGSVEGVLRMDSFNVQTLGDLTFTITDIGAFFNEEIAENINGEVHGAIAIEQDGRAAISCDHFHGRLFNEEYTISNPLTVVLSKNELSVQVNGIVWGNSQAYCQLSYSDGNVDVDVLCDRLPIAFLQKYSSKISEIEGECFLKGKITGPVDNPEGILSIEIKDMKLQESQRESMPLFHSSLIIDIKNHIGKVDAVLKGNEDMSAVTFSGTVPFSNSPNAPIHIIPDVDAPFEGSIKLNGPIEGWIDLLHVENYTIRGDANVSILLAGSLKDPQVNGSIKLTNGAFEHSEVGTYLKIIQMQSSISNEQLFLEKMEATDGLHGKVEIVGKIELDAEKQFPYTFKTLCSNAALVKNDRMQAVVSGDGELTGSLEKGYYKGKLEVQNAYIILDEDVEELNDTVKVVYINQNQNNKEAIARSKQSLAEVSSYAINLDIQLTAPQKIFIQGDGLSSEWMGSIRIAGTDEEPKLHGAIQLIRGRNISNGKIFELTEGRVNFNGDFDTKSFLYMIATMEIGEIIVEVILRGDPKNPSVAFRSNPPMSQQEILSWIIFGQGLSELTSFQGSQLSQTLSSLKANSRGGPDLLTKVRDTLGIDKLEFNRDNGEEKLCVGVGKYITKRVLLTLNRDITNNTNYVTIEAKLLKNIKAQVKFGDDNDEQAFIKWKKDY